MKNLLKKIIVWKLKVASKIVLKRYKPKIIAVSGSVGKSSTKDAIYQAIHSFVPTRKSQKSFNSEIGLPLTILDLPTAWSSPIGWSKNFFEIAKRIIFGYKLYPKVLILEVGSDRPGDIDRIIKWLSVDIVVMTRCPEIPVHVEYFKNPHELNEEDLKIIKSLKKDGVAIMNKDDEVISDYVSRVEGKVLTYGFDDNAEIKASELEYVYEDNLPKGFKFLIQGGGEKYEMNVNHILGKHHAYPILAGVAVAKSLGFSVQNAVDNLKKNISPKGRMNLIPGIHHSLIIDDTYNASPVALEEALNALESVQTVGKKICILGDMLELGKFTESEHKRLGAKASMICDALITVGLRAEDFAHGAKEAHMHHGKIHSYKHSNEAGDYIKKKTAKGDIVLVKGSQGSRMEKIVKEIMAEPARAKELLVRQEDIWERK